MVLSTKIGGVNTKTSTGTQAVTGAGFTPKAAIFFLTPQTTVDYGTDSQFGVGFAASTTKQASCATASANNSTGASARWYNDDCCFHLIQFDGNGLMSCALNSWDADGFTLNWTQAFGSALALNYLLLGGDDITNSSVVVWNERTTTGSQSVTGVGFKPDLLIQISCDAAADGSSTSYGIIQIGACDAELNQFVTNNHQWSTRRASRYQTMGSFAAAISTPTTLLTKINVTSMDDDGFTFNQPTCGDTLGRMHYTLCLKFASTSLGRVGSFNKTAVAAPAPNVVYPMNIATTLASMFVHCSTTTNANAQAGSMLSIGAGDASTNRSNQITARDNVNPTLTRKALQTAFSAITTTDEVSNNSKGLVSAISEGTFTMNWTTNDAVASEIPYITFGSRSVKPSICASHRGSGVYDLFSVDEVGTGTDNIYWKSYNGSSWSSWSKVGGSGLACSRPVSITPGDGTVWLFVLANNGLPYYNYYDGSWHSWTLVPNSSGLVARTNSELSVCSRGTGLIDLFYTRDTMNGILWNTWNGSAWASDFTDLGGEIYANTDAAAVARGTTIDLVVLGTNFKPWHKKYSSGSWGSWAAAGATACAQETPVLVYDGTDVYYVVQNTSNTAYYNKYTVSSSTWGTMAAVSGAGGGYAQSAVKTAAATILYFVYSNGDAKSWSSLRTTSWTSWTAQEAAHIPTMINGTLKPSVVSAGDGTAHAFFHYDNDIREAIWSGSAWASSTSLGWEGLTVVPTVIATTSTTAATVAIKDVDGVDITNCVLEYIDSSFPPSGTTITNLGQGGAALNGTASYNDYTIGDSGAKKWNFRYHTVDLITVNGSAIDHLYNGGCTFEWFIDWNNDWQTLWNKFQIGTPWTYITIEYGYNGPTNTSVYFLFMPFSGGQISGWADFAAASKMCIQIPWGGYTDTAPVVYINGVAQTMSYSNTTISSAGDDSETDLVIGDMQGNVPAFGHYVHRVYNTKLTPAQLTANYNASKWRITIVNVTAPTVTATTSTTAAKLSIQVKPPKGVATTSITAVTVSIQVISPKGVATTSVGTATTLLGYRVTLPKGVATTSITAVTVSIQVISPKGVATTSVGTATTLLGYRVTLPKGVATTSITAVTVSIQVISPKGVATTSVFASNVSIQVISPKGIATTSVNTATAPAVNVLTSKCIATTSINTATAPAVDVLAPKCIATTSVISAAVPAMNVLATKGIATTSTAASKVSLSITVSNTTATTESPVITESIQIVATKTVVSTSILAIDRIDITFLPVEANAPHTTAVTSINASTIPVFNVIASCATAETETFSIRTEGDNVTVSVRAATSTLFATPAVKDIDGAISGAIEFLEWPETGTTIDNVGTAGDPYKGEAAEDNDYYMHPSGATGFLFDSVNDSIVVPNGIIDDNLGNHSLEWIVSLADAYTGAYLFSKGDTYVVYVSQNHLYLKRYNPDKSGWKEWKTLTTTIDNGSQHYIQIAWGSSVISDVPNIRIDNVGQSLLDLTDQSGGEVITWIDDSSYESTVFGGFVASDVGSSILLFRLHNRVLNDAELIGNYAASQWRLIGDVVINTLVAAKAVTSTYPVTESEEIVVQPVAAETNVTIIRELGDNFVSVATAETDILTVTTSIEILTSIVAAATDTLAAIATETVVGVVTAEIDALSTTTSFEILAPFTDAVTDTLSTDGRSYIFLATTEKIEIRLIEDEKTRITEKAIMPDVLIRKSGKLMIVELPVIGWLGRWRVNTMIPTISVKAQISDEPRFMGALQYIDV